MKNQIRNLFIGAGLAGLLSATTLIAETRIETVEVPFDFHAGQNVLPRGQYVVRVLADQSAIQFRDNTTNQTVYFASPSRGQDKGKTGLMFRCYREQCFLSEILFNGAPSFVLGKSNVENKLQIPGILAYLPMQRH